MCKIEKPKQKTPKTPKRDRQNAEITNLVICNEVPAGNHRLSRWPPKYTPISNLNEMWQFFLIFKMLKVQIFRMLDYII